MNPRLAWVPMLSCLLLSACAPTGSHNRMAAGTWKIASWNLEHLAESDGLGCRPRTEADYAALRAYAERLDADVIAFQEVENEAAAARVFPESAYTIVMSARPPSGRTGYCERDASDGPMIREQKVGYAVRKGIAFERNADFSGLALGDPDLRWGVDITLAGQQPLRLLAVHLKSGCSAGSEKEPCPILFEQVPELVQWIAARRQEGVAFAVLGDFNRRLALAGDTVWKDLNQGAPLVDAAEGQASRCLERYPDFIDHIVLDAAAAARRVPASFEQFDYGVAEVDHPSDHCPISVRVKQ